MKYNGKRNLIDCSDDLNENERYNRKEFSSPQTNTQSWNIESEENCPSAEFKDNSGGRCGIIVTHCYTLVADNSREATLHVSLVLTTKAFLCLLEKHRL